MSSKRMVGGNCGHLRTYILGIGMDGGVPPPVRHRSHPSEIAPKVRNRPELHTVVEMWKMHKLAKCTSYHRTSLKSSQGSTFIAWVEPETRPEEAVSRVCRTPQNIVLCSRVYS